MLERKTRSDTELKLKSDPLYYEWQILAYLYWQRAKIDIFPGGGAVRDRPYG